MIVINPGSENKGGTLEQAKINAQHWLDAIHEEGFLEVEMEYIGFNDDDGDYQFHFIHNVTKKIAVLETHGFDVDAEDVISVPKQYWNGSSTANPKTEDWLEDGWKYRIEYYKSN